MRVLEARDRIGGRIATVRGDSWPVPIELGAEFVQGRVPELIALAAQAATPVVELVGSRWLMRAGRRSAADVVGQINALLSQLPELGPHEDQSFGQFLASGAADESLASAAGLARLWIESYDAADVDRVSVRFLVRERAAEHQIEGNRSFRLVAGYDGIPHALQRRILPEHGSVHLQTIATDVHWERGAVTVDARTPDGLTHGPFRARRLVVTLPLGVLQAATHESGAVRFTPSIEEKVDAVRGLEMGHVVKLVLAFTERFWESKFPDELGFLIATDGQFRRGGRAIRFMRRYSWPGQLVRRRSRSRV